MKIGWAVGDTTQYPFQSPRHSFGPGVNLLPRRHRDETQPQNDVVQVSRSSKSKGGLIEEASQIASHSLCKTSPFLEFPAMPSRSSK